MAKYHYDEAGNMAAYFLISCLAVVLIPLTLSLSPASRKQLQDGCQCHLCIEHRQRVQKEENGTFLRPKVSTKTIFIIVGWMLLAFVCLRAARAKIENKIYNPFEILGLRSGVTEKDIKAHFKKLSRIYHPDKVKITANETMESIASRFVDITKAYKSLTDETIRKNWELYGHPDGRQEMSMGIALPHWIIEGKNNIWVLSFYALIFGGALPIIVGRWWFGSRQRTKDGVNAQSAAISFKMLKEDSGMDEVMATLGRCFQWEYPNLSGSAELNETETRIREILGKKWSKIRKMADSINARSNHTALIILFAYLLRIDNLKPSQRKEQGQLLLQIPQLLNALLTVSTSRSWLIPTLSVMRLHAFLAQALAPGNEKLKFAQLPGIRCEEVDELVSQVSELEGVVDLLDAKGDSRIEDIKKTIQQWGRLELVEASFKVIGERVITPSAIVFLVVKLRISPPLDSQVPEPSPQIEDAEHIKQDIKMNEEKDTEFLTNRNEAEDLPEDNACGWAHAPYWPVNRKPAWWLVLADDKTNRVVVPPIKITDVPFTRPQLERNYRSYKLQFQAPQTSGLFTWKIYLISDTFVGEDITCDITVKIHDVSALDPEDHWEDDISEPDEDSLAGQMALMKGGSVKRAGDGESNDESSTDDEQSNSDSDSD